MTLQHLLPLNQNAGIENKFEQHILYAYLDFVCKPIAAESKHFALRTGELFYQCVYTLDTLKGLSPDKLKNKCTTLWAELVDYMRSKNLATNDLEVIHAISLIAYSVERCLYLTRDEGYTYPAGIVQSIIQRYDAVFARQILLGFNRAAQLIDIQSLSVWLSQYMLSPTWLSDDIEIAMELSPSTNSTADNVPTDAMLETVFKPAYMKTNERRMLVSFLCNDRQHATDGDWARYALAICRCKKILINPTTFSKWLPKFCALFGRTVPYSAPSTLDRTSCVNDISIFLPA